MGFPTFFHRTTFSVPSMPPGYIGYLLLLSLFLGGSSLSPAGSRWPGGGELGWFCHGGSWLEQPVGPEHAFNTWPRERSLKAQGEQGRKEVDYSSASQGSLPHIGIPSMLSSSQTYQHSTKSVERSVPTSACRMGAVTPCFTLAIQGSVCSAGCREFSDFR